MRREMGNRDLYRTVDGARSRLRWPNAGQTFVVTPTGVDDTANIQNALNQAAAHPGSVVELTAGDFYLSKAIVVVQLVRDAARAGQGQDDDSQQAGCHFQVLQNDPVMEPLYGEPGPART